MTKEKIENIKFIINNELDRIGTTKDINEIFRMKSILDDNIKIYCNLNRDRIIEEMQNREQ